MKSVLVYRRGAIIECYEFGGKFWPVSGFRTYQWNEIVGLPGVGLQIVISDR